MTGDRPTQEASIAGTEEPASEASTESSVLLRIVTPSTTPEEVAAIVAVFSALGGDDAPRPKARPQWNTPARMARPAVSHGPGGWRASALPR